MEAKPESAKKDSTPKDGEGVATVLETIPIKNDGSFMERFLQMQKEQEEAKAREAELAKKGPAQSRKTNAKPTSSVAAAPPKSSSATKEEKSEPAAKRSSEDMKATEESANSSAPKSKADEYKEVMKKFKEADCRGFTRGSALVK